MTGPSGSGKTVLARVALGQIAANSALVAEVNCWQAKSPFAVMDSLVRDLRILGAAAHDTNAKRERLERLLRDRQLVILLYEIDRPSPSSRNAILYALSTLPNVGIIATAQDATILLTLEPRIRSRFQPTELKLSGYPKSDLTAIVNDRAETALRSGAWSDETVAEIVSRASGDARRAIGLLTASARCAEGDRSPRIQAKHIRSAFPSALDPPSDALPDWLTTHHALIHELVADRGPIATADLYARYAATAKKRQMIPAARRTFTDYVSSLIHAGKLLVDDTLTKGNHRVVRVPADGPAPNAAEGGHGETDPPSSS
ncbi:MAG TPA: AAA family ATPase [Armatimonadota bacterium]|nr:AAA family ATPase [Armatimonadota bacterium]